MRRPPFPPTPALLLALCSACHTTTAAPSSPSASGSVPHEPSLQIAAASSATEAAPAGKAPSHVQPPGSGEAAKASGPQADLAPSDEAALSAAAVHYALAKHIAHAELRRANTQLFDFGVPGDAKYTLGGWLTFAGERRKLGDTRALVMRGKSVKLALPSDEAGEKQLVLRVRAFRDTALTVHVNGQRLGDKPLSGKDFETLTLSLPSSLVQRGENLLELRVARSGSMPGMPQAGFAVDYIALAPAAAPVPSAPPEGAALASDGNAPVLQIEDGLKVGYALDVPQHARLRGSLSASAPAKLVVSAVRDGAPTLVIGSLTATPQAQLFDLDLSAVQGTIARLDLEASGGAVQLTAPAVVTPSEAPRAQPTRKPIKNAIIVLIDTLRADKLSPYNDKTRVRTPGLNRFLKGAGVMLNARTQENWTKPSVATLLSSLFPWQHSAYTDTAKVPDSVELLPELLRKRGFYTGAFIANGYVSDKFGFGQGWNTYRNYIREGRRTIAQAVAADMLDWLDSRPQDKPFFLYVHTIDPHVPYKPPKSFLDMYDPGPYDGPVDFGDHGDLLERIKIGKIPLKPRDKQRLEALYDGEISYHDVHFAAMLEGLQKRGIADETMIVVTADHGEEFWDHGSVGHGHSVWDELLHVPLMLRIPGVTDGRPTSAAAVGLVDVAPTLLEALGQEIPEHMAGHSFMPELLGQQVDAPRTAVSGFMTGWRTLALGRHKLVHRTIARMWLYDTAADPGETQDLAQGAPLALRYLRGQLGLSLDGRNQNAPVKAVVHKQENTKIDAATEAQLRALGYVGSSRP